MDEKSGISKSGQNERKRVILTMVVVEVAEAAEAVNR